MIVNLTSHLKSPELADAWLEKVCITKEPRQLSKFRNVYFHSFHKFYAIDPTVNIKDKSIESH